MKAKQIAMKHFAGGNGTFVKLLRELRGVVRAADEVLRRAEEFLPPEVTTEESVTDPTGRAEEDWREEERWAVALTHLAIQQGAEPFEVRTTFGWCECQTDTGLRFYWSRWEMEPGYALGVVHPTGQFPPGSRLRHDLELAGWQVRSYDAKSGA